MASVEAEQGDKLEITQELKMKTIYQNNCAAMFSFRAQVLD